MRRVDAQKSISKYISITCENINFQWIDPRPWFKSEDNGMKPNFLFQYFYVYKTQAENRPDWGKLF